MTPQKSREYNVKNQASRTGQHRTLDAGVAGYRSVSGEDGRFGVTLEFGERLNLYQLLTRLSRKFHKSVTLPLGAVFG